MAIILVYTHAAPCALLCILAQTVQSTVDLLRLDSRIDEFEPYHIKQALHTFNAEHHHVTLHKPLLIQSSPVCAVLAHVLCFGKSVVQLVLSNLPWWWLLRPA